MAFDPFEVNAVHLGYIMLGAFVVIFGMLSLLIKEKLYIGEAPLATIFGIIIGPYAIGLFDPRSWGSSGDNSGIGNPISNEITLEVTRVVLAIGVFAIGVELPKQYMKKHWRSLAFLLGPVMVIGWFVAAGLIYGLIPGLSFLSSFVIAACLTPTDLILAAAVVGGKYANKFVTRPGPSPTPLGGRVGLQRRCRFSIFVRRPVPGSRQGCRGGGGTMVLHHVAV